MEEEPIEIQDTPDAGEGIFEDGFGDSHEKDILGKVDRELGDKNFTPLLNQNQIKNESDSSSSLSEFLAKYGDSPDWIKPQDGPDGISVFKIDANHHWIETDASGKQIDHTQKIMESGDKQRLNDHLSRIENLVNGGSILEERVSGKDIYQDVQGGAKVETKQGTKYASLTFLKSDGTIGFEEREFINKELEQYPFQFLEEVSNSLDWSGGDWVKVEELKESQVLKKADKDVFSKSVNPSQKTEVQRGTVNISELDKQTLENLHVHGYAIAETTEIRQILFAGKDGKVSFEIYRQRTREVLDADDGLDDDAPIEKEAKTSSLSPTRPARPSPQPKLEKLAITLEAKSLKVDLAQGRNKNEDRSKAREADIPLLQKTFTIQPKAQKEQVRTPVLEIVGISLVEDEALDFDENDITPTLRQQSAVRQESQKPAASSPQQPETASIFESFLALDAIETPAAKENSEPTSINIEQSVVTQASQELPNSYIPEISGISLKTAMAETGSVFTEAPVEPSIITKTNIEQVAKDNLNMDAISVKTSEIKNIESLQAITIIEHATLVESKDQQAEMSIVIEPVAQFVVEPAEEQLQTTEISQPTAMEQAPVISLENFSAYTENNDETAAILESSSETGILLMENEEPAAITISRADNLKSTFSAKPAIAKNIDQRIITPAKVESVKPAIIVDKESSGIEIVNQEQKIINVQAKQTRNIERPIITRSAIPQLKRTNSNFEKTNRPETAVKTFTRTEPQAIKIDIQRTGRQVSMVKEVREIAKPVVKPENLKIPAIDKKEARTTSAPSLAGIQRAPQKQQGRLTREVQRLADELTALSKLSNRHSPTRPGFWNKEIANRAITSKPASVAQDKQEIIDNNSGVYERELAIAA